jgi:PAS domain S-box-containing protein
MRTSQPRLVLILAFLAGCLLFLIDMALPQIQFGVLYLLCLIAAYLWGRRQDIYIVAALLSGLLLADYLLVEPPRNAVEYGNYLLRFIGLWAIAWLLAQRLDLQEQLIHQKQQLEQDIQARTADLRASEQRQHQVAERFARLFHSSPNPTVLSQRLDGRILEVNDAFVQVSGYTRRELIGSTSVALDILSLDVRAGLMEIVGSQEHVCGLEFEFRDKAGNTVPVLSFIDQLEVDGEVCLLLSLVDIGARKHMEQELRLLNDQLEDRVAQRTVDLQQALDELQRASRLKDEFMAMVSHELRTPLTGVLSLTELLAEEVGGPLTPRQAKYVRGITQSGARLLEAVNSILSYTQLLAGMVEIECSPVLLTYLLNITATARRAEVDARRQTLQVAVDPHDLTIMSDATALAGILKRLLDNAIKFTPEGGQIGVEAQIGAQPGTIQLVVWDTGIGILPGQLEHIVKPFIQADATLTRLHEGVGLGLAYAYHMVQLLGGHLDLESEPGHGSRFIVSLPAEPRPTARGPVSKHLSDHRTSK